MVRLLDLSETVQRALRRKKITAGHARAILGISDPRKQEELSEKVQTEGLSVRATEQLVKEMNRPELSVVSAETDTKENLAKQNSPQVMMLEQRWKRKLLV